MIFIKYFSLNLNRKIKNDIVYPLLKGCNLFRVFGKRCSTKRSIACMVEQTSYSIQPSYILNPTTYSNQPTYIKTYNIYYSPELKRELKYFQDFRTSSLWGNLRNQSKKCRWTATPHFRLSSLLSLPSSLLSSLFSPLYPCFRCDCSPRSRAARRFSRSELGSAGPRPLKERRPIGVWEQRL